MKSKKIITYLLVFCLMFAIVGCKNEKPSFGDGYAYKKESDTMLKFSSSDSKMDAFLNDYLHRHLRYDDKRIGDLALGSSVMFNKEWEAMSLFFFDTTSTAISDDRVLMMENFLYNIPVDRFGYTWQAFNNLQPADGAPTTYFGQGWPFPDYAQSLGFSEGWEFNAKDNDKEGWTAFVDGNNVTATSKVTNGIFSVEVDDVKKVEFISPVTNINTFHSPFLEIDARLLDSTSFGPNSNIEDVYVSWQTQDDPTWSDSKKVSQKGFSTLPTSISSSWSKHMYFPMWLNSNWGKDKVVTKLKIEVVAKINESFSGSNGLSFVRGNYDTRHSNNSTLLLQAGKMHYEYTGKKQVLADNLNRYRSTVQFLLSHLDGATGLIDQSYFTGHGGDGSSVGNSIGNGYWDILSTPQKSLYSNVYFYKAIKAMEYMERMAEELELNIPKPKVDNALDNGEVEYVQTSATLRELMKLIKTKIQEDIDINAKTGFWDKDKGRFIEGFDATGNIIDYGFIMFNLEVIAEDLATPEQAKLVMDWISGERIVESDTEHADQEFASGKVGTAVKKDGSLDVEGTFGIYDLEFAPRATTVKNRNQYVWAWGGTNAFGEQVQDGGAIMYTSYYDIISRIKTYGADNGFDRLKGIQNWYEKVSKAAEAAGVGTDMPNDQFYRVYYDNLGMMMQGGGAAGGIGLDTEFLESAIVYSAIPDGFFGLGSDKLNVLNVTPNLPSNMTWWKMENLAFNGVVYDLTIGKDFAQIDSVRGATKNLTVDINFTKPQGKYKILVNGIETSSVVNGSTITVNVPLRGCKIQIKNV